MIPASRCSCRGCVRVSPHSASTAAAKCDDSPSGGCDSLSPASRPYVFFGRRWLYSATVRMLSRVSVWNVTLLGLVFLGRFGVFGGVADVVAPGPVLVLRAGRPSGAGAGRFRRVCRAGCCRAGVVRPAADPGGGEAAGFRGLFPGVPGVLCEGPGEAELGVGGGDQRGSQVGRVGFLTFGAVRPRGCFLGRKVCSGSKRRRKDCHQRSLSAGGWRWPSAMARPVSAHGRRAGARPSGVSTCRAGRGFLWWRGSAGGRGG